MNDFMFRANWYDVIKAYDDAGQTDTANAIAKEIITYGVTGNTKTTDPLIYGIVKGVCSDQIKRVNKGGRPPKYDVDDMFALHDQGLSEQDIADNLGCNIRTVQRALAKKDEI